MFWNAIGIIAGFCTTGSLVPQVFGMYKTKSMKDVTYGFLIMGICGVAAWFAYSCHLNDAIMMTFNGLSLTMLIILLCGKIYYAKLEKKTVLESSECLETQSIALS